jgi:hypothetical protein
MSDEERLTLSEMARIFAAEKEGKPSLFVIMIVDNVRISGILAEILIRNQGIPKKNITQLGSTASDEQNAAQLQKRCPVVIIAAPIVRYRPVWFCAPKGTSSVCVIDGTVNPPRVGHLECDEQPFKLTEQT